MHKRHYLFILALFILLLMTGCKQTIHVHEFETFTEKEPTCTSDGYSEYVKCKSCNYSTYKKIKALGHDLVLTDSKPCCFENGYEKYKCTRCEYTETKELNKIGHHTIECDKEICPGKWHEVLHNCKYCGVGSTPNIKNRYFVSKLNNEQFEILKKYTKQ